MPSTEYLKIYFNSLGLPERNYSIHKRSGDIGYRGLGNKYRYARIYSLLFYWEDDDLGVRQEAHDLAKVFFHICEFTTVIVAKIPSRKSHAFVDQELQTFTGRFSSPNNLLVVYYAGHGSLDVYQRLNWSAYSGRKNLQMPVPEVKWHLLQSKLLYSKSDTLILFDCCYSAAPITASTGARGAVTELIAACGFDTETLGPGPLSFTTIFMEVLICTIRELKDKCRQNFSVVGLHQKIVSRTLRKRMSGSSTTPVYMKLRGARSKASIPLRRLDQGAGGFNKINYESERYL